MAVARADVAYLCRRAGFGATSDELDALSTQPSINALVDTIVDDPRNYGLPKLSPNLPPPGKATGDFKAQTAMERSGRWYLERMSATRFVAPANNSGLKVPAPLREKMTLFWHGLLVSSMEKPEVYNQHPTVVAQHRLLRLYALDDYQTLLTEVSRDPAMLLYLDNWLSTADNPNENYAREVQELFSLGVGKYSQAEVVAAAKAGTGYTLDEKIKSIFDPDIHDNNNKTFFGVTANWDLIGSAGNSGGHDIIQYICTAKQALVAEFIGRLLWQYFASFTPSAPTLAAVVAGFTQSGQLQVKDALKTIFKHPDFWAAPARSGKVKNPAEWVVTCVRALQIKKMPRYRNNADAVSEAMHPMGLMLFFQPNVSGWWRKPETKWIGFPSFTSKIEIVDTLVDAALKSKKHPLWGLASQSSDVAVDTILGWFGVDPATAGPTRTRAIEMFDSQVADDIGTYVRVRNLARLVALSPAAQIN